MNLSIAESTRYTTTLSSQAVATPAERARIEHAHQLQSTFTEVLSSFGQEGFASAEPVESSDTPLENRIQNSWHEWFDFCGRQVYSQRFAEQNPDAGFVTSKTEQLQQDYADVMTRAFREGGYLNPSEFVKALDRDQLATLQMVQGLANPIDPGSLNEEGALNLLIPPAAQVDANHDGLTQVGIGLTIRFPDSTTPRNVRDAWEQATAGMEPGQKAIYELQMKHSVFFANMTMNADGTVNVLEPGDPKWQNPMDSSDFSYEDLASRFLEYLDYFRAQIPAEQYTRDYQFWSDFRDLL